MMACAGKRSFVLLQKTARIPKNTKLIVRLCITQRQVRLGCLCLKKYCTLSALALCCLRNHNTEAQGLKCRTIPLLKLEDGLQIPKA